MTLHKLQCCAHHFINIDMPSSRWVLVFIYTLAALEDEASSLLLRLALACMTHPSVTLQI